MPGRRCRAICLAGAVAIVSVFTAHADSAAPGESVSMPVGAAAVPASSQASPEPAGTVPPTPSAGVAVSPFGFLTAAPSSPNLLGDMCRAVRVMLQDRDGRGADPHPINRSG